MLYTWNLDKFKHQLYLKKKAYGILGSELGKFCVLWSQCKTVLPNWMNSWSICLIYQVTSE